MASATGWRDGCDEAVALARDRLYEPRVLRRVAQRRAHLQNAEVEPALEVDERVLSPEMRLEIVAQHDLARSGHEKGEHTRWLRLQLDRLPVAPELTGARVELEGAETISEPVCRGGNRMSRHG